MKDSGIEWIGEIPEGWDIRKFKGLLRFPLQYGANESGDEYNENLPRYIRITDISIDNKLKYENKLSLSREKAKNYILSDGDILFARSGATVGKTFIFKSEYGESSFAGYLIKATTNEELYNKFAYNYTLSLSYEEWKNRIFIQATIQNIGANKYGNMEIPLPPLTEQRAIADFLDRKCSLIDSTIEKQKAVIEKLKLYKQSVITETVTKGLDPTVKMKPNGIKWIGDIPEGWEVRKLKFLSTIKTGATPPSSNLEYFNGEYDWFTPSDFNDDIILKNSKRKISYLALQENVVPNYPAKSVLIIGIGATTGKIGYTNSEASSNQQITAIMFMKNHLSLYFLYLLISMAEVLKSTALYTTLPILNNESIGQFFFVVPPLVEQQVIADFLDRKCTEIDNVVNGKRRLIEKLTDYKKSLIYECVTGKRECNI